MDDWVAPGKAQPPEHRRHQLRYRPAAQRPARSRLPVLIAGGVALALAVAVLAVTALEGYPGLQELLSQRWRGEFDGAPRVEIWIGAVAAVLVGLICWVMGMNRSRDRRPPLAWIGVAIMLGPIIIMLVR